MGYLKQSWLLLLPTHNKPDMQTAVYVWTAAIRHSAQINLNTDIIAYICLTRCLINTTWKHSTISLFPYYWKLSEMSHAFKKGPLYYQYRHEKTRAHGNSNVTVQNSRVRVRVLPRENFNSRTIGPIYSHSHLVLVIQLYLSQQLTCGLNI